jgi:hypothetical protein
LVEIVATMETPNMRKIHLLEGDSNFVLWKLRLQNLLEMDYLWHIVEKVVVLPKDPKGKA